MENSHRRLMWHGMFLFLLGLITGFAEQHFANIRMGLAAHLEGVMNGTFLLALGAAGPEVRLPGAGKVIAYWTILYSTYANWFFTMLAAIFRDCCPVSHHRTCAYCRALERGCRDGRPDECRHRDRRFNDHHSLGSARQGAATMTSCRQLQAIRRYRPRALNAPTARSPYRQRYRARIATGDWRWRAISAQ